MTRGARGHRRDRARRRGDDVLDRRGVRAGRLHAGHRRAVVQAVRAHDRRARCSSRSSCRSRSTRCSRRTGPIRSSRRTSAATRSRARSTASTAGSTARRSATSGVIAWALDHRVVDDRASPAVSFVARDRAAGDVRRLRLRADERPQRAQRRRRDAAGLEPRVHDAQGRSRSRRSRARIRRSRTPTRPSAARPARARWTTRTRLRAARAEGASATISQDAFGQAMRTELRDASAARPRTCSRPADSAANQKQLQLQLQGPDANVLSAARRADRRAPCAPRRARWTSASRRKRTEAGARTCR